MDRDRLNEGKNEKNTGKKPEPSKPRVLHKYTIQIAHAHPQDITLPSSFSFVRCLVLHEEFSKSMFVFFPVLHGPNKTRVGEGEMSEGERRDATEAAES